MFVHHQGSSLGIYHALAGCKVVFHIIVDVGRLCPNHTAQNHGKEKASNQDGAQLNSVQTFAGHDKIPWGVNDKQTADRWMNERVRDVYIAKRKKGVRDDGQTAAEKKTRILRPRNKQRNRVIMMEVTHGQCSLVRD